MLDRWKKDKIIEDSYHGVINHEDFV